MFEAITKKTSPVESIYGVLVNNKLINFNFYSKFDEALRLLTLFAMLRLDVKLRPEDTLMIVKESFVNGHLIKRESVFQKYAFEMMRDVVLPGAKYYAQKTNLFGSSMHSDKEAFIVAYKAFREHLLIEVNGRTDGDFDLTENSMDWLYALFSTENAAKNPKMQ